MAEQEKTNPTQTEDWVMVPRKASMTMLNAAIDVDSLRLGNISPLGFRCSPQTLFERCWSATLSAAPTISPRGSEEGLLKAAKDLLPLLSVIDLWDDCPYPESQKRRIAAFNDAIALASLSPRGRGAEEAVADLREYAEHRPGCDYWAVSAKRRERSCDCGLDDALAALSSPPVSGGGGSGWHKLMVGGASKDEFGWNLSFTEWPGQVSVPMTIWVSLTEPATFSPPPATGEVGT